MVQRNTGALWTLSKKQHGVVERGQLLDLGFSVHAISHRIETGRLHPVHSGVYAVGRPTLTQHGQWMAAVLSCGPSAALSHASAAALWGLVAPTDRIDVSVPAGRWRGRAGVIVHRRPTFTADDVVIERGIRVMTAIGTLIDIAAIVSFGTLEAAINEADKRRLANPSVLRAALDASPRRPGIGIMRKVLDRRTFALTDSELERRFLPLARRAGLGLPLTGRLLNGFRVDFYWPDLRLVVETDGLRYHRTPAQQARDRLRDQTHTAAGLTCLRFTHAQVRYEPAHVIAVLSTTGGRLRAP